MFNYTKEVIINSLPKTAEVKDGGVLILPRIAQYKLDNIVDKKIFKTVGNEGEKHKITITVPAVAADAGVDVLRLTMFLGTPNVQLAEFGTPCWKDFGKPIIVEVKAEVKAADGAKRLREAIALAAGEYVNVVASADESTDATVVLEVKELWMVFQDITLAKVTFGKGDVIDETVEEVDGAYADTVAPVAEFATANWIEHNLRFPTAPNRRYAPLNADELPIPGKVYTQYVFKYVSRHSVPGGLSGIDQCVDSITSHVFYVNADVVETFEDLFKNNGCTLVPVEVKGGVVSSMNPYAIGVDATAGAEAKKVADEVAAKVAKVAKLEESATVADVVAALQ